MSQPVPLAHLTPEQWAALLAGFWAVTRQRHPRAGAGRRQPVFSDQTVPIPMAGQADLGSVPTALADLIRVRLERLPGAARQVLQAAAVLEPDFDFPTLRRTAGRSEEECLDALDALLGTSVLVNAALDLRVRASAGGNGDTARAQRCHGALSSTATAAEVIEATPAGRPELIAGRLAGRLPEAGDAARAAHYAEMATRHTLSLAAPSVAIDFYRLALAWEPTPERQLGLGSALYWRGDLDGPRTAYTGALVAFEAQGDRGTWAGRVFEHRRYLLAWWQPRWGWVPWAEHS